MAISRLHFRFSLQLKWKKKIGEEKKNNKKQKQKSLPSPSLPALKMGFQDRRPVGGGQGTRQGQWMGLWKFAFKGLRDLELLATGVSGEAEALL